MKAMIGMSGGVDSSVAAFLMQRAGFTCIGATMRLYTGSESDGVDDARAVAARMDLPFYVFDFSREFRDLVMSDFACCYQRGLTPNPCVTCNRHLKFDLFLEKALQMGCQRIATGHYARVKELDNGRFCLQKAIDEAKDQTYFLCTLTQHQLRHTCFPLGELTKAQARQIAEEQGFINARKRDSQDICFIPDGDYPAFLASFTGEKGETGNFLDENGNIVGQHRGAVAYTLGQRKGLGLAMGAPVYVCAKDMAANTVTVGPNASLFRKALLADGVNWMAIDGLHEPLRCSAKVRSRMTEQPCTVYPAEGGSIRVEFDEPQRAITPGQAVAFYSGDLLLGGATITQVL